MTKVLCAVALLTACAHSPAAAAAGVDLGEAFDLKVGQVVSVGPEGLTIGFERVVSDSRCPRGVQCIRAGEVTIRIRVEKQTERAMLELSSPSKSGDSAFESYTIRLVGVTPYPEASRQVAPDDYVARLLVMR